MYGLDIAVVAVVVISGLLALSRGLVQELLSVAGWVAAAAAALYLFPFAQPLAREVISLTWAADLTAGGSIFLVTLILVSLVSRAISRQVRESGFSPLDRSLGFVFGAARGAVLLALAFLLLNWAFKPDEQPDWVKNARTLPAVAYTAQILLDLTPEGFIERATSGLDKASRKAKDAEGAVRSLTRKPGNGTTPESKRRGYSDDERKAMDRAVERTR